MRPHQKDMPRNDAALDCFNELLQGELPEMLTRSTDVLLCSRCLELHSSLLASRLQRQVVVHDEVGCVHVLRKLQHDHLERRPYLYRAKPPK